MSIVNPGPRLQSHKMVLASECSENSQIMPIMLRSGRDCPPLFLTPSSRGTFEYAATLVQYIREGIPVYGLQLEHPGSSLSTIEGMATRMIRMMKQMEPIGPYRVAGWSSGGLLAYEIGQQLRSADHEVCFVGLLDTRKTAKLPQTAIGKSDVPQATGSCLVLSPRHLQLYESAVSRYSPGSLSGKLIYFNANSFEPGQLSSFETWKGELDETNTEVHQVKGTHSSMLEQPFVKELGATLSSSMALSLLPARSKPSNVFRQDILVPLRSSHCASNMLLCIPGAGASVTSFAELANWLDASWDCYGFQPRGLDGLELPHGTIEAAVAYYLAALPAATFRKTLYLMGHSLGGWVAYELRAQLLEAGIDAASLIVIDSEPPDVSPCEIRDFTDDEVLAEWIHITEAYYDCSLGLDFASLCVEDTLTRRKRIHSSLVKVGALPRRSTPDLLRGPMHAFAIGKRMNYHPRRKSVKAITLVLAKADIHDAARPEAVLAGAIGGWQRYSDHVEPLALPANHVSILRSPHCRTIASRLGTR